MNEADLPFMQRALLLAKKGMHTTMPNPRVGCVLVKEGKVLGEGFHEQVGAPHAEINALLSLQNPKDAKGATAYVTLEPCSHHGRTPPCAEALINAGIARVVIAMQDPNPQVAGRGIARLQASGILLEVGLCQAAARALNPGFISRMENGKPWVRLKVAMSLDGKIALSNGASQWITGAAAREDGHLFRARACAILTGIGTVLKDDPALTVRGIALHRSPHKIIVDSTLRLPKTARLFEKGQVWVATAQSSGEKYQALAAKGVTLLPLPNEKGQVDLPAFMCALAAKEINELHVEAGARLNAALLEADLVDELLIYIAPKMLGEGAKAAFPLGLKTVLPENEWQVFATDHLGEDVRIRARKLRLP